MNNIFLLIIPIIIALLSGFFGYKLHKIMITLCWLIIGFMVAGTIVANFTENMNIILISASIIGILTGFFGMRIEKASIFILCFVAVLMFSYTYIDQEILKWAVGIIGGIIGGLLGIKFAKAVIIISTSFQGAILLGNTLLPYFKITNETIMFITTIVIAIFAIYFQCSTNKQHS